jgi:hypothetical protein
MAGVVGVAMIMGPGTISNSRTKQTGGDRLQKAGTLTDSRF